MRKRWLIPLLVLAAIAAGAGYYFMPFRASGPSKENSAAVLDRLHSRYLSGSTQEARQALTEEISLISSEKFDPGAEQNQADVLWLNYCRLYALDKFAADEVSAAGDFQEAKKWYGIYLQRKGQPTEEVVARKDALTADQCLEMVRRHDPNPGPHYAAKP